MVDAVTLQTLTVVITGASVVIGVAIGLRQLSNVVKNRQLQFFLEMAETYRDRVFTLHRMDLLHNWKWEDIDDYKEKYGSRSGNIEDRTTFRQVAIFFDMIGWAIRQKMFDIDLLPNSFVQLVVSHWNKMSPIIYIMIKNWGLGEDLKCTKTLSG